MRGLCISFTSSYFLFPVRGGRKSLRDGGVGGLKILGMREVTDFGEGSYFYWGGQYTITFHSIDRDQWHEMG